MPTTFPTTPLIDEWDGAAGPITASRPQWPADVSGLGALSAELNGSGAFGRPTSPVSSFNSGNFYDVDLGGPDHELWMACSMNQPGIELWLRVNNQHDPNLVTAYVCRFPGLLGPGVGTFLRYGPGSGVGYVTLGTFPYNHRTGDYIGFRVAGNTLEAWNNPSLFTGGNPIWTFLGSFIDNSPVALTSGRRLGFYLNSTSLFANTGGGAANTGSGISPPLPTGPPLTPDIDRTPPATFPTTPILDDFSAYVNQNGVAINVAAPTLYGTDFQSIGSSSQLVVSVGDPKLVGLNQNNDPADNWYRTEFDPDQEVYVTRRSANQNGMYLLARLSSPGTTTPRAYGCYYARIYPTVASLQGASQQTVQIGKIAPSTPGGSPTFIDLTGPSAGMTFGVGDAFGLRCAGSRIQAWMRPSGGSWRLVMQVDDTSIPYGNLIGWITNGGGLDDFGGGAIVYDAAPTGNYQARRRVRNQLGCGRYTAAITTRGGDTMVFADLPVSTGSYSRVLDDTSDASVTLVGMGRSEKCFDIMRTVRSGAHELALSRDGVVVWQGPVTKRTASGTSGGFAARDLSAWWDRRKLPTDRTFAAIDVATIFQQLVTDAMSQDTSPKLTVTTTPTGITATRKYLAGQELLAGPEIRELAKVGVDWTAIGRTILAGGLVVPADPIVLLNDSHLSAIPTVEEDGLAWANDVTTIGAGGGESAFPIIGIATDTASSLLYGLSQDVQSNDSIRDSTSAIAASATRVALMSTPPVTLSDIVLREEAPVLLEQLIPGSVVGCSFSASGIQVAGLFRLKAVKVNFAAKAENVTLTLQPIGTTS